jgi:hypothetical protein
MEDNDVLTLEKKSSTPLINEENLIRMKAIQNHLKKRGVKPTKFNTTITNCGSCGNWSSKQKCNLTDV